MQIRFRRSPVMLESFLQMARSGQPVYLHTVQKALQTAPGACSVPMRLALAQEGRFYETRLPLILPKTPEETDFLRRYLHARIYNILSAYGGRCLMVYLDPAIAALSALFADLPTVFGVGLPRAARTGYGKCINVADRMNHALGCGPFSMEFAPLSEYRPLPIKPAANPSGVSAGFQRAIASAAGHVLCGLDVGGTDIKACLAANGTFLRFKEYDWNPASFPTAQRTIAPLLLITRLLRDDYALLLRQQAEPTEALADLRTEMDRALRKDAPDGEMLLCCEKVEAALGDDVQILDGIGLSYPDVVIRNRLVGGETPKTAGMRANPNVDYETEFAKLTNLCEVLRLLCKTGGVVRCVNDGHMAAYTAAVELSVAHPNTIQNGVFANPIGTGIGNGWVDEAGVIPEIPMELYNFITDLGNEPGRKIPASDIRSTRNSDTGLCGTLERQVGQAAMFHFAATMLPKSDPARYQALLDKGYFTLQNGVLSVPTAPEDLRKPFLAFLMQLAGSKDAPESVKELFRMHGEAFAAALLEIDEILHPKTDVRMLFGRLVKEPACFALLQEGVRRVTDRFTLQLADDSLACTPLMKRLAADPHYTVAQFAQAVGAVYFAAEECEPSAQ